MSQQQRVAIIGAGPAGLTAGYLLAKEGVAPEIFEGDPKYVGGISKTATYNGYHFDIGGHRFFSKSQEVEDLWTELLPNDMLVRPRSSRILYRERFFSYPLKAVEALRKLGIFESVRCGFSYLWARLFPVRNPRSFQDWVSNQFGHRLFQIFFKTYTEKVWGMDCREISADWAAQRIKGLSLFTAVVSSLMPKKKPKRGEPIVKTLIESFRYPRLGPGMMWEACAEKITQLGGHVHMGRRVRQCRYNETRRVWTVTTVDAQGQEQTTEADHVISTTPVRELCQMVQPAVSAEAARAANSLKYRDFITVVLILKDRNAFADNWIYIHDPSVLVGRVQNFKSWSPEMVPDEGNTCYGLEYFCFEHTGLWNYTDEELQELGRQEIVKLGLAQPEDLLDAHVVRQKKAYPVYDDAYAGHLAVIRQELEQKFPNLHLIGRNGMHKYNNQDHSMMTAMLCAKNILAGEKQYDLWAVNEDAEYHESGEHNVSTSGQRQIPRRLEEPEIVTPAPEPAPAGGGSWSGAIWAFLIVCAVVFPLLLGLGMTRGLSHDEHQHVAAGALIAREGLMPYRDFPHFHTPYLPFAYAAIFKASDHLLTSARLISVLCATGILGFIGSVLWSLFRPRGRGRAAAFTVGGVLLALTCGLFVETTGRAWNHEPSLFLVLLAFGCHLAGLRAGRSGWFVGSGLLLALAIGVRITCAPLLAPFGLALWLFPQPGLWRWSRVAAFTAGTLAGLSGLFYLIALAPEQAYFGNLEFSQVNIAYRLATGEPRTMTVLTKLRFFFKVILRPDAALFAAALLPLAASVLVHRRAFFRHWPVALRFALLLIPFLLMGSFAPSPLFDQYFYPLVPFALLIGGYALASMPAASLWYRRTALACGLAVIVTVARGLHAFEEYPDYLHPSDWHTTEVHREGVEIRDHLAKGEVLTLAPILPMEAGFSIYPTFTPGAFAWRVSPFIEPAKADRLLIASPTTLEAVLDAAPPDGIFTGLEKKGEDLLKSYAERHAYRPYSMGEDDVLWVKPDLLN